MLTPITVTWGPVVAPSGQPVTGALTFTLSSLVNAIWVPTGMVDSVTGETVLPNPVIGAVNNGMLLANPVGGGPYTPLVLLANDDPATRPVGTKYNVVEQLSYGSLPVWQLTVHFDAADATMSLASQRPTP